MIVVMDLSLEAAAHAIGLAGFWVFLPLHLMTFGGKAMRFTMPQPVTLIGVVWVTSLH